MTVPMVNRNADVVVRVGRMPTRIVQAVQVPMVVAVAVKLANQGKVAVNVAASGRMPTRIVQAALVLGELVQRANVLAARVVVKVAEPLEVVNVRKVTNPATEVVVAMAPVASGPGVIPMALADEKVEIVAALAVVVLVSVARAVEGRADDLVWVAQVSVARAAEGRADDLVQVAQALVAHPARNSWLKPLCGLTPTKTASLTRWN
jgi:hypothetical protein